MGEFETPNFRLKTTLSREEAREFLDGLAKAKPRRDFLHGPADPRSIMHVHAIQWMKQSREEDKLVFLPFDPRNVDRDGGMNYQCESYGQAYIYMECADGTALYYPWKFDYMAIAPKDKELINLADFYVLPGSAPDKRYVQETAAKQWSETVEMSKDEIREILSNPMHGSTRIRVDVNSLELLDMIDGLLEVSNTNLYNRIVAGDPAYARYSKSSDQLFFYCSDALIIINVYKDKDTNQPMAKEYGISSSWNS